jgi:hypothetical protein
MYCWLNNKLVMKRDMKPLSAGMNTISTVDDGHLQFETHGTIGAVGMRRAFH